jgi:UDP-3-O-[3-hydroxymyristoyl] glucosamine N-acyltransferase
VADPRAPGQRQPEAASQPTTLGELSARFGLELRGDPDAVVTGVGTLEGAGPGEVAFLANPLYRRQLSAARATAVILRQEDAADCPVAALVTRDPYSAFARIAALFETAPPAVAGIDPSAVVDPTAHVDPSASVGALCSIGARARVGAGAVIGAGSMVGPDCEVGADCELVARATLVLRVRLGQRVRVHPGAVLGADGFGLAMQSGRWIKVPQLGGVVVGDDCEIGANTCIDRGALDDTVLEEDVRIDNLVQVGHNVRIGAHTANAGTVAIAGSTRIGSRCLIGGGAGFVGHITICDGVTITAMSLVTRSITEPGEYSSGTPIQRNRDWRRNAARFKQLDQLARKIARHPADKD